MKAFLTTTACSILLMLTGPWATLALAGENDAGPGLAETQGARQTGGPNSEAQEQAEEYREWSQSRPEGLSPRCGSHAGGKFGGRFGGGHGSQGRGHFGVPSQAPAPEGTAL